MLIRIAIITVVFILFFLTPRYFLNDILEITDKTMICLIAIAFIIYGINKNCKPTRTLSMILSVNTLLYFFITVRESIPDTGNPRMLYRINAIMGFENGLANEFGRLIEYLNYIQVLASLILLLSLFYYWFNKRGCIA